MFYVVDDLGLAFFLNLLKKFLSMTSDLCRSSCLQISLNHFPVLTPFLNSLNKIFMFIRCPPTSLTSFTTSLRLLLSMDSNSIILWAHNNLIVFFLIILIYCKSSNFSIWNLKLDHFLIFLFLVYSWHLDFLWLKALAQSFFILLVVAGLCSHKVIYGYFLIVKK